MLITMKAFGHTLRADPIGLPRGSQSVFEPDANDCIRIPSCLVQQAVAAGMVRVYGADDPFAAQE